MHRPSNILRYLSAPSMPDWAGKIIPLYYAPEVEPVTQAATVGVHLQAFMCAGPAERAAIYVSSLWAMRIGEYLRLTTADILGRDMVFVPGEKGSASYRILLPGICRQFAPHLAERPGRLVCGTNYKRVYTACVRIGLGILEPGHLNVARTHVARYTLAKAVHQRGERAAGDLLHHRSTSAAEKYLGAGGK